MQNDRQPFFSIVMAAYNSEKTIAQSIRSVQKQSFEDFELIIVNDGSTDQTENVVNEIISSDKDTRIRFFNKNNSGAGNTKNYGIDLTKGKYLLFLDSDDVYVEGTFKILYDFIQNDKPDYVIFNYARVQDNDDEFSKSSYLPDRIISEKLFEQYYSASNKVYSSNLLKKNNIKFSSGYFDDVAIPGLATVYAKKVKYLDETLYLYRMRTNSIIRSSVSTEKGLSIIEPLEELYYKSKKKLSISKQEDVLKYINSLVYLHLMDPVTSNDNLQVKREGISELLVFLFKVNDQKKIIRMSNSLAKDIVKNIFILLLQTKQIFLAKMFLKVIIKIWSLK